MRGIFTEYVRGLNRPLGMALFWGAITLGIGAAAALGQTLLVLLLTLVSLPVIYWTSRLNYRFYVLTRLVEFATFRHKPGCPAVPCNCELARLKRGAGIRD